MRNLGNSGFSLLRCTEPEENYEIDRSVELKY